MTHPEIKQRFLPLLDRMVATDARRLKDYVCALIDSQVQSVRARFQLDTITRTETTTNHETEALPNWCSVLPTILPSPVPTTTTATLHPRKLCRPSYLKKPVFRASPSSQFHCEWPRCDRSFRFDYQLAVHERVHLGVRPFSCAWPQCQFDARQSGPVLQHIRQTHFRLRAATATATPRDRRNWTRLVRVDTTLVRVRVHSSRKPLKPFQCTWPECGFGTEYRGNAVTHVRCKHLHLPTTVKQQRRLGIVDHRRPHDYVRLAWPF